MLTIDAHSIHNTVSVDRVKLAPGKEPPTNAFQQILVEENSLTALESNERNTETEPAEYAVDQIVSHEGSGDEFHFQACWYRYLPENDTPKPSEYLSQRFIHCYWEEKP